MKRTVSILSVALLLTLNALAYNGEIKKQLQHVAQKKVTKKNATLLKKIKKV